MHNPTLEQTEHFFAKGNGKPQHAQDELNEVL